MNAAIGDLVHEILATRQRGYVAQTGMLNERESELIGQIRDIIFADHITPGMLCNNEEGWAVISDGKGQIVLIVQKP